MKVRETSQPFNYEVESRTKPGQWYWVNLLENDGGGACECRDHETRRQPAINKGHPLRTKATMCAHVEAAMWHLIGTILDDQSKHGP